MKIRTLTVAALLLSGLAAPALANTYMFDVVLSGLNESPPNASPGAGTASMSFDDTTLKMQVDVSFAGLVAGVTAAHIHCCTAVAGSGNVGVAVGMTGFPTGVAAGSYNHSFDLSAASFGSLLAGAQAGKAYLNIHTQTFPGGEIRGFLMPVPEPETYALMGLGLAGVALAAKRRQRT